MPIIIQNEDDKNAKAGAGMNMGWRYYTFLPLYEHSGKNGATVLWQHYIKLHNIQYSIKVHVYVSPPECRVKL